MSNQLWVSLAMLSASILLIAVLRGVRMAAYTAAVLILIGGGYVFLVRNFQGAGKWALAVLILLGGALVALNKKRKR